MCNTLPAFYDTLEFLEPQIRTIPTSKKAIYRALKLQPCRSLITPIVTEGYGMQKLDVFIHKHDADIYMLGQKRSHLYLGLVVAVMLQDPM